MPPAVGLAIGGLAGGAGSAMGGKKGANAAKKAAEAQAQMQQQMFQTGLSAWQPAANYWQTLLKGDPNAVAQATGPYADLIRQQAQASQGQIAATMPAGGEANMAQAQNINAMSSNMARLFAGMQPTAAQALGQLAGMPMQLGAPNVGSGLKYQTHQQEQLGQSKGSLGTGLGQLYASARGRKGGGGGKGGAGAGASQPTFPMTSGLPGA